MNCGDLIRDLIRLITKDSDDYDEKYMKIKFNSDGELPINKMIEILSMIIVVRAVFQENNKYHPQVFLDKSLYEYKIVNNIKMLYYDRINISEGINVNNSAIIVTIGIFYIKALSFNEMSAMDAMIY